MMAGSTCMILHLLVFLLTIRESIGWCRTERNSGDKYGCVYENRLFIPLSETRTFWEPNCVKCTCYKNKDLNCCSVGFEITNVDPECEVLILGCFQKAVLKNNHNEPCPNFSAVGR